MFRSFVLFAVLVSSQLHAGSVDRQPAYLLEVPPSVGLVLLAETETSTLHLFENEPGGLSRGGETYMSIGQKGAGKIRAWDRRTPLGTYFINEKLDTSKLHEKYGPVAFPLDYPNIWDRKNRRSGDGIWIHGVTPGDGRRPPLDTDGCIALPNDQILALESHLVPHQTPVIVTRNIRWATAEQVASDRDKLRNVLDQWATSFEQGDVHRHMSLYADDFTFRGMNTAEWAAFRTQSFNRAPPRRSVIDEVLLLADPVESGLYLSRFRQSVTYDDSTVETTKRLYWQETPEGELRIVAEDNG
jgi:murein L,D-transpeptidase YafK